MNAGDLIRRLHQHRRWVNQHLLEAAQELSEEQLLESFPIGQGSVWKTLTHLMAAEHLWLEALLGNEDPVMPGDVRGKIPGNQEAEDAMTSLEELTARWQALEERWSDYLSKLTDESLEEIVYKISTSFAMGQRRGTRRADVLLHVCTHAQYTIAQLVNMLRGLGRTSFPEVMLISLARQES